MMNKNAVMMVSFLCFVLAIPWIKNAEADTIYLKDGAREESDRVWASDNYIHFILKGTRNVEIRVAKDFVDHIEREATKGESAEPPVQAKNTPKSILQKKNNTDRDSVAVPKKDQVGQRRDLLDSNTVEDNKGLSFYDPHRPRRYWAEKNAKFKTLEEALSELARRYGRSVAWVQENMGEENDLGMIHYHLMQRLELERHSETDSAAGKGDFSPKAQSSVAAERAESQKPVSRANHDTAMLILGKNPPGSLGGPQFYDPRRKKKYWISSSHGFNTLNEALAALAQEYHVPVSWIEQHMGDSNRLEDIHRNIRESLSDD